MDITENVHMIGDNRVSFTDSIVPQDRQDMMDLMLYAEMYASGVVAQNHQPERWHEFYHDCLIGHGCSLISFLASSTASAHTVAEVEAFKVTVVSHLRNSRFTDLVNQSLAALRPQEKARHHLQSQAMPQRVPEKALLCKVSPCYGDEGNQPIVSFCGLVMRYEVDVEHGWLGDTYRRFVTLTPHGGCYHFDRAVYATYRTQVLANTEGLSGGFFGGLQA